jgi:hypothetical protein
MEKANAEKITMQRLAKADYALERVKLLQSNTIDNKMWEMFPCRNSRPRLLTSSANGTKMSTILLAMPNNAATI